MRMITKITTPPSVAMDKLSERSKVKVHNDVRDFTRVDEVVQANSVFDLASLILYGSQVSGRVRPVAELVFT